MDKKYDIVIYGATSFVGDIITGYLMERYRDQSEFTFALAARNEAKLLELKQKHKAQDVDHMVADSFDEQALTQMANSAKVILSTVGPYALYGETLVKVCAYTGTDYCDLTGESHWYKAMLDKYHDKAVETGARIVPSSGFDSIPSDLGTYFVQQQAKSQYGEPCKEVKNVVAKIKGGASGGTIASAFNIAKEAAKDKSIRKVLLNPFSFCPKNHGFSAKQDSVSKAKYDKDFNAYLGPFVMALANTKVVHRSNALLNNAYGDDFKYLEASKMGKGEKAKKAANKMGFGLKWFMILAAVAPTRWLLKKFLPKPGQGPTAEQQHKGMFEMHLLGKTQSGNIIEAQVCGDKDPGYGSTSRMILESAICLLHTSPETKGGFWTPAALYGNTLLQRLEKNAGLSFKLINSTK
ncbi:trans-acting enoyl reductase family protein [Paraferrimonas sp. SM1919]|uniref:saccharopine dehydrogenase family protein n=1 Tax=Paraferrimonas sp. SM1919 TaxID=2662263 RepID=UPI0013D46635|nr:saccharopine dehydrogenase NADP-binding domain-containing protein [Paraferrimonas sp. SM1919]